MGDTDRKTADKQQEPRGKIADKSKKPPQLAEEEYEDGDIATPKRDGYGTDDEPL